MLVIEQIYIEVDHDPGLVRVNSKGNSSSRGVESSQPSERLSIVQEGRQLANILTLPQLKISD